MDFIYIVGFCGDAGLLTKEVNFRTLKLIHAVLV
jgi:hypothetical protein